MQKWEYLQVRVERIQEQLTVYANSKQIMKKSDSGFRTDFLLYINSLGEQGWEMINAQDREYGFESYFFKRPLE